MSASVGTALGVGGAGRIDRDVCRGGGSLPRKEPLPQFSNLSRHKADNKEVNVKFPYHCQVSKDLESMENGLPSLLASGLL